MVGLRHLPFAPASRDHLNFEVLAEQVKRQRPNVNEDGPQLTPHASRVPMKCIGIVGHPLPLGEGLEFLHSPLSPLGERGPGVRGSLANAHSGSIVKN